jgi:homocysteine S-methyltransferase
MASADDGDALDALRDGPVLVIDGGLATELERRGATLDAELWSARLLLDDPPAIADVHAAYVDAGADVLITASYQASLESFRAAGVDDARAIEAIARSVELARDAAARAARRVLVAASVGTIGASLPGGAEYRGRFGLPRARYVDHHVGRLEALLGAEPDLIAVETLPDLEEARVLSELLDERGARGWLSFTCADGERLRGGAPIEEAFALCQQSRAIVAAGVNCTAPEHVEALLRAGARACRKPLLAYPNSGEGWDASRRAWTPAAHDDDIAALAPRWVDAGARALGGCCRTTPDDIAALRAALLR